MANIIWLWIWLLAWPFKPEWLPVMMEPEIRWDGAGFCLHGIACYSAASETAVIHLNPECPQDMSLDWQYFHELQHHLQRESGIMVRNGGGEKFADIVKDLIRSKRYSDEHQLTSMKGLMHDPRELHAELPRILKGQMPKELADWYPWFRTAGELETASDRYLFLTGDLHEIKKP